jgi:hypothetical protein
MQAQKRKEKLTVLPGVFYDVSCSTKRSKRECYISCLPLFLLIFLQKIPHGFSEKIIGIPLSVNP